MCVCAFFLFFVNDHQPNRLCTLTFRIASCHSSSPTLRPDTDPNRAVLWDNDVHTPDVKKRNSYIYTSKHVMRVMAAIAMTKIIMVVGNAQ